MINYSQSIKRNYNDSFLDKQMPSSLRSQNPSTERQQDIYQMNSCRNNTQGSPVITQRSSFVLNEKPILKSFNRSNNFSTTQQTLNQFSQSRATNFLNHIGETKSYYEFFQNNKNEVTPNSPFKKSCIQKVTTSKKQEHLQHRNLNHIKNDHGYENHRDKIRQALQSKSPPSKSPLQISQRLKSLQSVKKNIHLRSSQRQQTQQSENLSQIQMNSCDQKVPQIKLDKPTQTIDQYQDIQYTDQGKHTEKVQTYYNQQSFKEQQNHLIEQQLQDISSYDSYGLKKINLIMLKTTPQISHENNKVTYQDTTYQESNQQYFCKEIPAPEVEQEIKDHQISETTIQDHKVSLQLLRMITQPIQVVEDRQVMSSNNQLQKGIIVPTPQQSSRKPWSPSDSGELDSLDVYQIIQLPTKEPNDDKLKYEIHDNIKKKGILKNTLRQVQFTEVYNTYIDDFVIEYTRAYEYLNIIGRTVAKCLEFLNGKQNFWIIPLFLVFKRMFQLRTEAEISMNDGENILQMKGWAEVISSQQYQEFKQKIQNENDQVEKEMQELKDSAIYKANQLEQTRKNKIEWFLNDDLNQDIKDTSFIYLYSQILKSVRSHILGEAKTKFKKIDWMILTLEIQICLQVCDSPALKYPSDVMSLEKLKKILDLNDDKVLQIQLDQNDLNVNIIRDRLKKSGYKL